MSKIFIIILRYVKPIEEIDALRTEHLKYLDKYYASGCFQASGMQNPRTGGVIICKAESREKVLEIIEEDNFNKAGAAEYQVFEFTPNKFSEAFKAIIGAL